MCPFFGCRHRTEHNEPYKEERFDFLRPRWGVIKQEARENFKKNNEGYKGDQSAGKKGLNIFFKKVQDWFHTH